MNGAGIGYVVPSMVAWRSSMTSNSAACVLAGARLISSMRTIWAKTGPWWNENSPVCGLKTCVPSTSEGIRSGVNWTRL